MPPRYEGHDDYKKEEAELASLARQREEVATREVARKRELQRTKPLIDDAARAEEQLAGARREGAEAKKRAVDVADVDTRGLKANTDEIERNTAARQRAVRASVDFSQALKGAHDPMFAQAHALSQGGQVSQYAIRQQLEGVGQRRAASMQAAIQAGVVPGAIPESAEHFRLQRALVAEQQSIRDLTQANRNVTNLQRRKTAVSDVEVSEALAAQQAAKDARAEAARHVQSSREVDAAQRERALAERELARKERLESERGPGTDIVRRTPAAGAVGGRMFGERMPGPFGPLGQVIRTGTGDPYLGQGVRAEVGGGTGGRADPNAAAAAQAATAVSAARAAKAIEDERKAMAAFGEANARAELSAGQMAAAQDRVRIATRNSAVEYGTLSQQMTRHGALTSEFIQAAARGEVTLRQLGDQAIITAGKFGGWTAAATALFGAATAIRRVGQGAMDASSGVHTLQRVITDGFNTQDAQQQFQQLAQEFNVPIATVVDAVYRMGQRFHSLPEAVSAARASLYSFKTGEVDVGTSTQNLIAITNGFGLSAQSMLTVYDQINQAQNVFGVKIGDTESGLAKAGGTFHQAGGDLQYLLGLMVAINRATSRPGTEIGTAVSRSVQQIRKPSAQATLAALGVDVDPNNIQKTIQSAMRQAQRGVDPNALAAGLFGNQYARLIAPVLADQKTLNSALENTTPEKSKGSAQRELGKVLAEAGERIKALGVDLETLGAALAEAGVFQISGIFLTGLDHALDVVNALINGFNRMVPPDLRPLVTSMAEIAAVFALIRRFGGFEKLAQRNPAFLPFVNQDRRLQIRATRGLRDQSQEAFNIQENLARREFHQRVEVEAARNRAQKFETDFQTQRQAGTLPQEGTQARLKLEIERDRLNKQFLAAEEAANVTAEQVNAAKRVAITTEQELVAFQKLHYTEVRAHLAQNQYVVPTNLSTPNLAGTEAVPAVAPGARTAEAAATTGLGAAAGVGLEAMDQAAVASENVAKGVEEMNRVMAETDIRDHVAEPLKEATRVMREHAAAAKETDLTPPSRTAAMHDMSREFSHTGGIETSSQRAPFTMKENAYNQIAAMRWQTARFFKKDAEDLKALGYSFTAMEKAAFTAVDAATGLQASSKGITTGLRSFGSKLTASIGAIAAGIGPIDAALFAYIGGQMLIQHILDEQKKHVDEMTTRSTATASSTTDIRRQLEDTKSKLASDHPTYENPQLFADQGRLENELRAQRKSPVTSGRHNYQLAEDTIKKQIDGIRERFKAGEVTQFYLDSAISTAVQDVMGSSVIDPKHLTTVMADLSRMGASRPLQKQILAQLDATRLKAAQEAAVAQAQVFGGSPENMAQIVDTYTAQMKQLEGKTDDKSVADLNKLRLDFYNSIDSQVQADLQYGLLGTQTEGQRRAVFTRAADAYRSRILKPTQTRSEAAHRDLSVAEAHQTAADDALAKARSAQQAVIRAPTSGMDPGAVGAIPTGNLQTLRDAAARAHREVVRLQNEKANADEEYKAALRIYRQKRDEIKKVAALQDREQGRAITAGLETARSPDAQDQAQIALRMAENNLRDVRASGFGPRSREYQQALTAVFQARSQVAQGLLTHVQSENALILAQAGTDPVSQAEAALKTEQNTYRAMTQGPNAKLISRDDKRTQHAAVIRAEKQKADAVRQEALDEAALEGQIAAARAGDDPVAAARAAQQAARRALASARTRKERLQAILDVTRANNQMEQALADEEQARSDYLQTLTTDPVEQARIAERQANKNVKGKHGAARYKALADQNRARQNRRDTELTSKEDDIEFEKQMGTLSIQGAISRYRELLNIKTLTKAQRRDIMLKIKALQDQGDQEASGFDLDVGSIKLPTVYDVRRAWDPVRGKVRQQAHDHTQAATQQRKSVADLDTGPRQTGGDISTNATTNATINIFVADKNAAPEVYAQLDRALKTKVRAKMRSKGKRG